jgi:DNA polymerase-3 subunit delta'
VSTTLEGIDRQPQARLTLEAALRDDAAMSHAYLFHGPAGTGKREVALSFAATLIARDADDPDDARRRVLDEVHPDVTVIKARGAQILVEDVRDRVVAQAALRPFEASRRVFVIVDADRMNETSQNAMLKTLEEPAPFAVFILISSQPGRLLETIPSRCRQVRFGPIPAAELAETLEQEGVAAQTALACARLSGGDGERARALAGPLAAQRGEAEAAVRTALRDLDDAEWRLAESWAPLIARAESMADNASEQEKVVLDEIRATQPKRGGSLPKAEYDRQLKRAARREHTLSLDLSLELIQLWLRDLVAVASGAGDQVLNVDRIDALREDAEGRNVASLIDAVAEVEKTRRHLERNVTEALALEALMDRLRRLTAPG